MIFLRIKLKGNLEIGIDHNLFQMNTSRSLLWIKPMQSVAYEPMTSPPNFNFGMIEELHVLLSDCKTGLQTTAKLFSKQTPLLLLNQIFQYHFNNHTCNAMLNHFGRKI